MGKGQCRAGSVANERGLVMDAHIKALADVLVQVMVREILKSKGVTKRATEAESLHCDRDKISSRRHGGAAGKL